MSLDQTLQQLERLAATTTSETPRGPREPLGGVRTEAERPETPPLPRPSPPPAAARVGAPANQVHPTAAFDEVLAKWPTLLERIGQQKMSLASYLMAARPLGVEGEAIQIGIPAVALHQEVLGVAEHVRLIEQLLGELLGQPAKIAYATLPEQPPSPEPQAEAPAGSEAEISPSNQPAAPAPVPPIVQDIVHLFDATIVKPATARPSMS